MTSGHRRRRKRSRRKNEELRHSPVRGSRGKSRIALLVGVASGLLGIAVWGFIVALPYLTDANSYTDILVAEDTDRGDWYGSSVGISGEWLAVGAFRDSDIHERAGAVYVRQRDDGTQVQKLVSPDAQPGDQAGFSVALDGQWLAVGSVGEFGKREAASRTHGRVELYRLGDQGWELHAGLEREGGQRGDRFGFSVTLSDDWLAVGARGVDDQAGEVLVYKLSDIAAPPQALRVSDSAPGDRFGESVSMAENTLIVGAPGRDAGSDNAGAAYLFERRNGTEAFMPVGEALQADLPDAGAQFGIGVDTDGVRAIVGASHWRAGVREGSVWITSRNLADGRWEQPTKVPVDDYAIGDMDGFRVVIDGPLAAASAHLSDANGRDSGSVVVFHELADGWRYTERLAPADGDKDDNYGIALALHHQSLLIGAEKANTRGRESGGVYLEWLNGPGS